MLHLMFLLSCRSDEQRSEKHKLKKEKEIEKEVLEAEREDDGGFSVKVKIAKFIFLSITTSHCCSGSPRSLLSSPTAWTSRLL